MLWDDAKPTHCEILHFTMVTLYTYLNDITLIYKIMGYSQFYTYANWCIIALIVMIILRELSNVLSQIIIVTNIFINLNNNKNIDIDSYSWTLEQSRFITVLPWHFIVNLFSLGSHRMMTKYDIGWIQRVCEQYFLIIILLSN